MTPSSLVKSMRVDQLLREGKKSIEFALFGSEYMNVAQELLDTFNFVLTKGFGSAGIYYESPLGKGLLKGDLSFFLRRESFYRNKHVMPVSSCFPCRLVIDSEWQKVMTLMDCWVTQEPFKSTFHQNLFFEFDLESVSLNSIPLPGVFFGCQAGEGSSDFIKASLELLEVRYNHESCGLLRKLLEEVLDKTCMVQVGVMLSRPGKPLRIVIFNQTPQMRKAILDYLGFSSLIIENQEIWEAIEVYQDGISGISLDFLPELGPRLGIEIDFSQQSNVCFSRRHHLFKDLLHFFDKKGLCEQEKVEAVLAFPSCFEYRVEYGNQCIVMKHDINHVKIDFKPNKNPLIKIYLRSILTEKFSHNNIKEFV